MKINHQLRALYFLEAVSGFGLAQVIWVVLLAGRGFSLAQIGLAEVFFIWSAFSARCPAAWRRTCLAASALWRWRSSGRCAEFFHIIAELLRRVSFQPGGTASQHNAADRLSVSCDLHNDPSSVCELRLFSQEI